MRTSMTRAASRLLAVFVMTIYCFPGPDFYCTACGRMRFNCFPCFDPTCFVLQAFDESAEYYLEKLAVGH